MSKGSHVSKVIPSSKCSTWQQQRLPRVGMELPGKVKTNKGILKIVYSVTCRIWPEWRGMGVPVKIRVVQLWQTIGGLPGTHIVPHCTSLHIIRGRCITIQLLQLYIANWQSTRLRNSNLNSKILSPAKCQTRLSGCDMCLPVHTPTPLGFKYRDWQRRSK